jgi:oligopeptide transport system permease protein
MTVQTDVLKTGVAAGVPRTQKGESLWLDAWRRLRRNRAAIVGGVIILLLAFMAIFAEVIAPYTYYEQTLVDNNKIPPWVLAIFPFMKPYAKLSLDYLVGADYVGRDILSRIIYGSRVSLAVALIAPIISLAIGLVVGSISGFRGGRTDSILMRIVDVLYAFPTILFVILLMAFFRSTFAQPDPGSFTYAISSLDNRMGGMLFIFIGLGITAWETMARLSRGQVLSVREKEYIEAARTIGVKDGRTMRKHVLPNIIGPLIVYETLAIPTYIALEAFLSFIGLGVNPPTPSWGSMIADGSGVVRSYPNQVLAPAMALAITMFAFNFLGDGLRDALDPRLRGTQ